MFVAGINWNCHNIWWNPFVALRCCTQLEDYYYFIIIIIFFRKVMHRVVLKI